MTNRAPKKEPRKLEREIAKARSGWRLLRDQFKRLRKDPGNGFFLFTHSHREASRWFFALLQYGVYSPDLEKLYAIDGAEQAETDEELADRNYAFGQFRLWARVARAGMDTAKGEWAKQKRPSAEMDGWLESAYATLDTKLFDVMTEALMEALADNQGYVMANIPKEPQGEQANFNLAALMREDIPQRGTAGGRLALALSDEGGGRTQQERRLLRELPGLTFVAWHDKEPGQGTSDLRTRILKLLTEGTKDELNRGRTRRIDPTLRLSQAHGTGRTSRFGAGDADGPSPQDELPEAELFNTLEAMRLELNDQIQRYKLSPSEAEVAGLRYEGKETHEIAAIMGIEESTVRATEFRIRNKIKKAG
jgi:DNA-directed RNA polymerase specialized sigma24 family protein